jgi:hypothetical protein
MLIFGNMAGSGEEKLAVVPECLAIDNSRSPGDYAQSLGLRRQPDSVGDGRAGGVP